MNPVRLTNIVEQPTLNISVQKHNSALSILNEMIARGDTTQIIRAPNLFWVLFGTEICNYSSMPHIHLKLFLFEDQICNKGEERVMNLLKKVVEKIRICFLNGISKKHFSFFPIYNTSRTIYIVEEAVRIDMFEIEKDPQELFPQQLFFDYILPALPKVAELLNATCTTVTEFIPVRSSQFSTETNEEIKGCKVVWRRESKL